MKKRLGTYKLNRDTQGRLALFKSLLQSLIAHEEIITTSAKAKAIAPIFEKLLSHARKSSVAARRLIQNQLQTASLTKRLVDDIAPRYQQIRGGYTSITPLGNRRGDNAMMVKLSLTKKTTAIKAVAKVEDKDESKKKTTTTISAPQIEKVAPVKAAPKLVRRTGKRGDK